MSGAVVGWAMAAGAMGGAVAAAAVLNKKINVKDKNVVVMLSGGNIDSEMFFSLI